MLRIALVLAAFVVGTAPAAAVCGPDALGTARTLTLGTAGGGSVGLKSYPRTLKLQPREVVLTFDDGPFPGRTDHVLKALADECVLATFFMVGKQAAAHPALAARVARDGHTVAYHTMNHAILRRTSPLRAQAEIDEGFRAVDQAAYGSAGPEPRTPFFRYPGFADTPELNAWLAQRNIVAFGADLWASDWVKMTPQAELELLMTRLHKTQGGIILMHDIQPHTVAMLPAFLRELKKQGFSVAHIRPGPGALETQPAPAGWTSQTESILKPKPPLSMSTPAGRQHPLNHKGDPGIPGSPL